MFELIIGGSGSGKSGYAERQLCASGASRKLYIATMIPCGEEGQKRIERHRRLRAGRGFETLECFYGLCGLELSGCPAVLLESLSDLAANELFECAGAHEKTADAVVEGIDSLRRQTADLFVVTDDVFRDGIEYDPETRRYQAVLGEINQRLANAADVVTEVTVGIAVRRKG